MAKKIGSRLFSGDLKKYSLGNVVVQRDGKEEGWGLVVERRLINRNVVYMAEVLTLPAPHRSSSDVSIGCGQRHLTV